MTTEQFLELKNVILGLLEDHKKKVNNVLSTINISQSDKVKLKLLDESLEAANRIAFDSSYLKLLEKEISKK